jgi:hypothetical protein
LFTLLLEKHRGLLGRSSFFYFSGLALIGDKKKMKFAKKVSFKGENKSKFVRYLTLEIWLYVLIWFPSLW